jgi:hypothetical protein
VSTRPRGMPQGQWGLLLPGASTLQEATQVLSRVSHPYEQKRLDGRLPTLQREAKASGNHSRVQKSPSVKYSLTCRPVAKQRLLTHGTVQQPLLGNSSVGTRDVFRAISAGSM